MKNVHVSQCNQGVAVLTHIAMRLRTMTNMALILLLCVIFSPCAQSAQKGGGKLSEGASQQVSGKIGEKPSEGQLNQCSQSFANTKEYIDPIAKLNLSEYQSRQPDQIISITKLKKEYPGLYTYPDFSDEENVDTFLKRNPTFGIASIGSKLIFISRAETPEFLKYSRTRSNQEVEVVYKPIEIYELPENYKAYDISETPENEINSEFARRWNGLRAWDDGPNCWNFVMLFKGWTMTTYSVDQTEFTQWANGPFTKPSGKGFNVAHPGDVIIWRSRFTDGTVQEMHGAILLTESLVLSKNSVNFEDGYELLAFKDLQTLYGPFVANTISVKSIPSYDEVWSQWGSKIDPEIRQLWLKWRAWEKQYSALYSPRHIQTNDFIDNEKNDAVRALGEKLKKQFDPAFEKYKAKGVKIDSEIAKVNDFFWNLLNLRINKSTYFVMFRDDFRP